MGFSQKEASEITAVMGRTCGHFDASSSFGEPLVGGSCFRLLLPGELARHSVSEGTKVRHSNLQRFERWNVATLVVGWGL